jgi:N-acetylglucosamine-6-phosphate deacetylase
MSSILAVRGARIFDGEDWHDGKTLLVSGETVEGIIATAAVPADAETIDLPAACSHRASSTFRSMAAAASC